MKSCLLASFRRAGYLVAIYCSFLPQASGNTVAFNLDNLIDTYVVDAFGAWAGGTFLGNVQTVSLGAPSGPVESFLIEFSGTVSFPSLNGSDVPFHYNFRVDDPGATFPELEMILGLPIATESYRYSASGYTSVYTLNGNKFSMGVAFSRGWPGFSDSHWNAGWPSGEIWLGLTFFNDGPSPDVFGQVSVESARFTYSTDQILQPPTIVTIDIKPGSNTNPINPRSNGVIPVAILTTEDFDATTVDFATVQFGAALPLRWALEDVDGDMDWDVVFKFKTRETGITCGATGATLTGKTFDGVDIAGTDSITTVGCSP